MTTTPRFAIRAAAADDAGAAEQFYGEAGVALPAPVSLMLQTGSAFLGAYGEDGALAGAVRHWDEDGIGWWDLLVSRTRPAGRHLVSAVEMRAQDRGLRLVRVQVDDASRFAAVVQRWGYRIVGHTRGEGGGTMLVLEKRLPLLTVREQRRADAGAIGGLTGEDPWVYEQGARPGVFVASDGDRVVGLVSVRDGGAGLAEIAAPVLLPAYHGRALDLWMLGRAAVYAETNGYHSATVAASAGLDAQRRALEERQWFREPSAGDGVYVRRFRDLGATSHED